MNLYLDKIFTVEKVNKHILGLFLRLFQENLDVFNARLDQRLQDTEFLASLIDALSQIDASTTIKILEYIYSGANELIKFEVLKAMRKLKKIDSAFLIRQLNTNSFLLRSEIISLLLLDTKVRNGILALLFKIPSFLGSKNALLIENMQIAFDLHFTEAAVCIKDLSHRKFFWNSQLRNRANQILKGWNVS